MPAPSRRVRIAYSPDADDAFMVFGFATGAVTVPGVEVDLEAAGIEELNRRAAALDGPDVSAISFAAWPRLAGSHDLLAVGSSFGLGVGPRLVAREPLAPGDLDGRVLAVPGEWTTAALLVRLFHPGARLAILPFDEIMAAVRAGEVDAGAVIHEGQLTWDGEGLRLVEDLGRRWADETGGLPVPLGANAVRRDLPADVADAVRDAFARSIRHAQAHREAALVHAAGFARGLPIADVGRYVDLYVNELTLEPGPQGRQAVALLLARGARAGLLPEVTPRWR